MQPAPAPPAARAVGLTKAYGSGEARVTALDDVSTDIPAGLLTAVMGPSGSGKSTLMHCLAGLDRPDSGRVLLGDTELHTLPDDALTELRRSRIGFVFQSFNLVPSLTAYENVVLPQRIAGAVPAADRVAGLADALGIGDRLGHRPHELSGGQQQRVAIARALITEPDVVFADEPTGNLDSRSSAQILQLLRRAVEELGRTVVLVTHDPTAATYADQVLFLADGRIADRIESPTAAAVTDRLHTLGTAEPALPGRV
ncbi:ABC transporter ATP-binding protein [Streptomyces sp. Da 82-17]|uniref:ABC transporter ATP-binding protein n=1 Tax=Streptomyces sp. Da 82-17 TaxID=3377116 RepID=UPI0038D46165